MTHTPQSKQNSTSEYELWFTKNNYMSKFLSEESKAICNKLKEKKYDGQI